jgi:hypothetical protein
VGFADEAALHDLVEENPAMLPLSGGPTLVVLGREVRLGSGYADLVAIEASGRPAIIEIKLRNNPEARRAVIAQVLAYAAYLYKLEYESFEELLRPHLNKLGARHISDALAEYAQVWMDADEVKELVSESLRSGAFRLVLVLDEVPQDLVALVGYLEAVAGGIVVDLVTVSAFSVNGSRIMVPQRLEPERVEAPAPPAPPNRRQPSPPVAGPEDFEAAIQLAPFENQPNLRRLTDWAKSLAADGIAVLRTVHGTTRKTLQVRIPGVDSGLITIATDQGGCLWLYPAAFARRSPAAASQLELLLGTPIPKQLNPGDQTDSVLSQIAAAYAEAKMLRRS